MVCLIMGRDSRDPPSWHKERIDWFNDYKCKRARVRQRPEVLFAAQAEKDVEGKAFEAQDSVAAALKVCEGS